jgi:hypothetical protein
MFRKPVQVTMSFPFVRCDKALDALRCLKNLEPPSVEGYARTVLNGINNTGWLYLGFLTGAKLKISGFVII